MPEKSLRGPEKQKTSPVGGGPPTLTAVRITGRLAEYPAVRALILRSFPPNERVSPFFLRLSALRRGVDFRAFYDDGRFVGILYTAEDEKMVFIIYLAVEETLRSAGYGTRILQWLKEHTQKNIVLYVEVPDAAAENAAQRERRIRFYERNGFSDTRLIMDGDEGVFAVYASRPEEFDAEAYRKLVKRAYLGMWKYEYRRG